MLFLRVDKNLMIDDGVALWNSNVDFATDSKLRHVTTRMDYNCFTPLLSEKVLYIAKKKPFVTFCCRYISVKMHTYSFHVGE